MATRADESEADLGSERHQIRLGSAPAIGALAARAPERALVALAASQHGVVAAAQLLAVGFTRTEIRVRVRQAGLHPIHAGIYAVGHPAITRHGHWMAAVLATGPTAVLSHRDAAALYELADFTGPEVEVTLPGVGGRQRPGIRVHRTRELPPRDRVEVDGVPVTSVERLLLDLARTIAPRHLRRIYVEALRKDLIDTSRLAAVLASRRGRRGIDVLRRIRDELGEGHARTFSDLEAEFLDLCRREGLPDPLVNVWVAGYLVDAHWPDANLVVELDSWKYHRDRDAFERDRLKISDLRAAGIAVLPVTDRRLATEPGEIASAIRSTLVACGVMTSGVETN